MSHHRSRERGLARRFIWLHSRRDSKQLSPPLQHAATIVTRHSTSTISTATGREHVPKLEVAHDMALENSKNCPVTG
eukprot:s33_g8.t1